MVNRLLDLAIQIQQVPAPIFEEARRGEFIKQKFLEQGQPLTDIHTDQAGNVLARLPGVGMEAPLVISAHMDTVFPAEVSLATRREGRLIYGPGLGDNSLGVAGLFGILWRLKERDIKLPGDVWLVANTGEEGLGNLSGMTALVDHFGSKPKAYLVLEGMALGHIYHKAVAVQRYKIRVQGQGGHSWTDFGLPSAVHELSTLVSKISAIKPPVQPHTTLNVGRISGGTSINTIASDAWMELDLRSEEQTTLARLVAQVDLLAEKTRENGVQVEMTSIGYRPSGEISPFHPLIRLAQACVREQGLEPILTAGSTDANIPLSRGLPALVLGLTRGGKAHTVYEYIDSEPVEKGLEHILQFVSRVWN